MESICLTNSAFARIGQLKSLKKLSICIGYDARDEEVLQLKVNHISVYAYVSVCGSILIFT